MLVLLRPAFTIRVPSRSERSRAGFHSRPIDTRFPRFDRRRSANLLQRKQMEIPGGESGEKIGGRRGKVEVPTWRDGEKVAGRYTLVRERGIISRRDESTRYQN